MTADDAIEVLVYCCAEHATHVRELAAGTCCVEHELRWKRAALVDNDAWQYHHGVTRLMLAQCGEEVAVELGDTAATAEGVRDKREQPHAATPCTYRAQPRKPRWENRRSR